MKSRNAGSAIILTYDGYSDADVSHRPVGPQWQKSTQEWMQTTYLSKIAQKYMEDTKKAEPEKAYRLERLPPGYEVWEKSRNSNTAGKTHVDRFCFGHPNHGGGFNSPYDFYPHFLFLIQSQNGDGVCDCRFCKPGKSVRKSAVSRSSSKPAAQKPKSLGIRGRPPVKRGPVDDEGNSKVITRCLSVLHHEGHIDRKIEERTSMDWRVETVIYEGAEESVLTQPSFVPRIGELVLFRRETNGRRPEWMGGIVTQVPISAEPVILDDITEETPKNHNVNSSGFRVECLPNPNDKNKSFSKQYNYVPLCQIRPMSSCNDTLDGVAVEDWHPTISNVMTAMGSVSCVQRYKIKGIWPNFSMFCRGIYVGAEAGWAGEPLRLMPRGQEASVIDVMIPEAFVVRVHGLELESDGTVTGNRAEKIHLLAVGHVYTVDIDSSERQGVATKDIPKSMHAYGPWYHKSDHFSPYETSFTCVLGRLYEFEAMQKWLPAIMPAEALNHGMESVRTARAYATTHRNDLHGARLGWFWGEDRASSLDLSTFNGIDVGEYDRERDPVKWQQVLTVLDGLKERIVEPVAEPNSKTDEASSVFTPVNLHKSSLVAPPATQTDSNDELGRALTAANAGADTEETDDVIDDLISGDAFPQTNDGSSDLAPAAKRAKIG